MNQTSNHTNETRKGYNRLSRVYDWLAGIFFFGRINKSQTALISYLSDFESCLIIGGGSGHFLEKLLKEKKQGRIVYLDLSDEMIKKAQRRIETKMPAELSRIEFRCENAADYSKKFFDLIVCHYFLDLFKEPDIRQFLMSYRRQLTENGYLYITDFAIPDSGKTMKLLSKGLLKLLYLFFNLTTSVQAKKLENVPVLIEKEGFVCVQSTVFWKGIMFSAIYKKRHPFIS